MENKKIVKVFEQAAFHRNIINNLNTAPFANFIPSPDTSKLVPFNGYYSLNNAKGAFFAIDANVYINNGGQNQTCLITFYLSLDGETSNTYQFSSGTFDGEHLIMDDQGISLNLTFTREGNNSAMTASVSGNLSIMPDMVQVHVSGSTYNNPIDHGLFQGTYYYPEKIILNSEKKPSTAMIKVLVIGSQNKLYYDYGAGNEQLKLVDSYVYNMNMYYFQFPQGNDNVQLIMGTAGSKGFACNNMVTSGSNVNSRSLQTIITANNNDQLFPNANSKELAAFSGYYPLPSINPLAFFSILGQYTVINGVEEYSATISYSFDGINSTSFSFGTTGMSFEDNELTLLDVTKKPLLNLVFKKEYTKESMMLVKMTGSIESHSNLVAYTPFNPVPLIAFGGKPMTNSSSAIDIKSGTEVKYTYSNMVDVMNEFIYVPLMYILANPWYDPNTVLSLGTSKGSGNVSIVIDVPTNKTTYVQAIPQSS